MTEYTKATIPIIHTKYITTVPVSGFSGALLELDGELDGKLDDELDGFDELDDMLDDGLGPSQFAG